MTKALVVLVIALGIGLFTRTWQLLDRYYYSHDADLAAWVVKDLVLDGHPRLIGQLTSSPGIFIGPLFYYLLVPLYAISGFHPAATLFYSVFIGLFSIFSLYLVVAKIWGRTPAGLAACVYAASFSLSQTERDVVPTTPVFLWTIWFIYSLHLILSGRRQGLFLAAVLFAAVWHIHLALGLLVVIPGAAALLARRFRLTDYLLPSLVFCLLSLPLLLFEVKHNFMQTRSLLGTFGSATEQIARTFGEKVLHVAGIALKDVNNLFWHRPDFIRPEILPGLLAASFLVASLQVPRLRRFAVIFLAWFILLLGFFIRHPINLSEYYLNSLLVPVIIMAAIVLARHKVIGALSVAAIVGLNLWLLISSPVNAGGFLARESIVDYIAYDAAYHGYPCVAISYMVDPGNDLGYRFLFFRKNLHVNRPDSNSPVYTIVFPHPRANRLDFTFGSLGLVLPDYARYTQGGVAQSCSGQNSNLTDPMFGFTN